MMLFSLIRILEITPEFLEEVIIYLKDAGYDLLALMKLLCVLKKFKSKTLYCFLLLMMDIKDVKKHCLSNFEINIIALCCFTFQAFS